MLNARSGNAFRSAGPREGSGGSWVSQVHPMLDGWTPNEPRGGRAGVFAPGVVEVWEDAVVFVVRHESIGSAQREHPVVSCVHFSGARGSAASGAASIRFCKEAVGVHALSLGRFFGRRWGTLTDPDLPGEGPTPYSPM